MKKVTATDVAEKAGVSKWAVSRAFTEGASIAPETRRKVLEAAESLGYRPNLLARGLITRKTHLIGLVVDELRNPNILAVLNEVTASLQSKGYLSVILNMAEGQSHGQILELAGQFQVDGLIFLGTILTEELYELARNIKSIPLVVLYRNSDHNDIQVVATDGYFAGVEIASMLMGEGYGRFGFMAGPRSVSTYLKRLEGFQWKLQQAGFKVDLLLESEHFHFKNAFNCMQEYILQTPEAELVDAVFCENDILAIGALDALTTHKLKNRIAIVGFDDISLASSAHYNLTSYRQPLKQLVEEAVHRVVTDARSETVPERRVLIKGELRKRLSHLRR